MKIQIRLKDHWQAIEMKLPDCEGEKLKRIVEDRLKAKIYRDLVKKHPVEQIRRL